ncbi:MAG: Ig-like domain-containing protein, partial [Chloroflexota bacterium]|nr:Ig-like domain-containing protein [Chloroflexota bacterium]
MKTNRKMLLVLIVLLAITLSCSLFSRGDNGKQTTDSGEPTLTATIEPTPRVAISDADEPLPPQVVATTPGGGQAIPVNAVIEIRFDQEMDKDAAAAAWQLTDVDGQSVDVEITWPGPDTINIDPCADLEAGATYTAVLTTQATSAEGVPMAEELSFTVNTLTSISINQVFPADGAVDVENMGVITVVFNRPIVPLKMSAEQADLPDPLNIVPPIQGAGEWVNTSVYVFQPEDRLRSATTYKATIPAGLTDVEGTTLEDDYVWAFTTALPTVSSLELVDLVSNPDDDYRDVPLDQVFMINFRQPMNHAETESAFSLTKQDGEPVEVELAWSQENPSMTITPTNDLVLGTSYHFVLDDGAQDAGGSPLMNGVNWHFTTNLEPGIRDTFPSHNTTQDYYSGRAAIFFNSPMDMDSLDEKVIITPAPEGEVEWTYNAWDWSMSYYGLEPSTHYTIRILPGMMDIYGNPITQPHTVHFSTASYSPRAYLEMPYGPAIYQDGDLQPFFIRYVNVNQVDIEIYELPASKFLSFVTGEEFTYEYSPLEENLVKRWAHYNTGEVNDYQLEGLNLETEAGEPLPRGIYFLRLGAWQGDSYYEDDRLVVVADANLTLKTTRTEALAWLVDLETGAPVGDVSVTIYDQDFRPIGDGVSDADGLLQLELPESENAYDARFAITADGEHFALASSNWSSGVSPYDFGIWSNYYRLPDEPVTYVYTDRPLYRPGHPVSFKGVLRLDDDLAYSLPTEARVIVEISSYDEVVYEEELTISEFGTFDGELLLDKNAALGHYSIYVSFPYSDDSIGSGHFSVAEYRKPEFQVDVSADSSEALTGDEFTLTVSADYFSGGAVANAEVNWTLSAAPYTFDPSGDLSRYRFDDTERDLYYYAYFGDSHGSEIIASDAATTDENGEITVTLPAELDEEGNSQQFTFEATITDLAGNDVSSRASLNVHQSSVYVGVRPQRYVGSVGSEQTFELVTVDWDAETVADQSVDVTIVERSWNSVQIQEADGSVHWDSSVEEIPVATFEDVTTDAQGRASVSFTPTNGGVFKAIAVTRDQAGNKASAAAY